MSGIRHKARVVALQTLYEIDCAAHHDVGTTINREAVKGELSQQGINFATGLVSGVVVNKKEIDSTIGKFAPAFPVDQIGTIDRNILRIAIFEILFNNKVPTKAAINEAVELAKTFGSDSSPRFVNGVLGSVVANLGEQRKETNRKE